MLTQHRTAEPLNRRRFVLLAASSLGVLGAGALLRPGDANATTEAMEAAIGGVVGERKLQDGRVKLDLPPIVENGNAVPLSVSVESPMTEADHVKTIHIFNEKNPQPQVAVFHLGPRSGRATVSTRVRLADTQKIMVIAEMSDGSLWSDSMEVIVTLAACIEG
jgi:sulfur-oxidizing protein SoxY